jgi:hypothetical protein
MMSGRPKSLTEIANELLRNSNPREMMRELAKKSPSLDDQIANKIDVSQTQVGHHDGK